MAFDNVSKVPAAAPVVIESDCDHVIQLGFHGAIQCTPEQCPWCHPELQQKTASPVTQWTRERLDELVVGILDGWEGFHPQEAKLAMNFLRDALLAQESDNGRTN